MSLKIQEFFASKWFAAICFIIAVLIIVLNTYVEGTLIFAVILGLVFLLTPDVVSFFTPSMLLMCFAIQAKNSYDDYMHPKTFICAGFAIACLLFHMVYYRKDYSFKKGTLFFPILLVSITCLAGGIGSLSVTEYFRFLSLAYMFGLGFAMLLVYVLAGAKIQPGKNGDKPIDERIASTMCVAIAFLVVAVLEYYVEHFDLFLENPGILPFQWRNNACTYLMIALPFAFYMGAKKHWAYYLLAFSSVIALVLSGSRGGLLLGGLEMVILVIYFAIHDKAHRKLLLGIVALGVIAVLALLPKLIPFMSYTLGRLTSNTENFRRIGLWKRSVTDFLAYPLNGRGLAYMGNRDLHPSSTATLCWYHSSIPQVIGSFGCLGILTYGYQMFKRLKLMLSNRSLFGRTVLLSFIGIELMSLVNPGIFVPTNLMIMTVLFVVVENYSFEPLLNKNELKSIEE